eukprot:24286_1
MAWHYVSNHSSFDSELRNTNNRRQTTVTRSTSSIITSSTQCSEWTHNTMMNTRSRYSAHWMSELGVWFWSSDIACPPQILDLAYRSSWIFRGNDGIEIFVQMSSCLSLNQYLMCGEVKAVVESRRVYSGTIGGGRVMP